MTNRRLVLDMIGIVMWRMKHVGTRVERFLLLENIQLLTDILTDVTNFENSLIMELCGFRDSHPSRPSLERKENFQEDKLCVDLHLGADGSSTKKSRWIRSMSRRKLDESHVLAFDLLPRQGVLFIANKVGRIRVEIFPPVAKPSIE
jgi:hypothetical protein